MFGSHKDEAELKTKGVIEAAQDPNSNVTSADAEKKMVEESRKAGGMAMQFDPDATPEQKAAQAKARVPDGFHHERKPGAVGIISDADGGAKADYDLPPPSKEGALAAPETTADGKPIANGAPTDDMRWARDRTGWAPRFGDGDPENDKGPNLLEHETWLEGNLEDKWFGDWYYNAGIMIFACLSTYIVTLLGGGLTSVFVILAFCATYYRTSLRRVRRNFRDDIVREMTVKKLETENESLEWINNFLVKFWPIYAPVLCDTIINSVDQVLSTSTPAFLDSMRMKTFVLGTKPPRLEFVKTYPNSTDDVVLMDWKFSFNPNDTVDMTARQLRNKVNPKVVLEVRVGKGFVSKGLDVIVEDFAFSGTMRIKAKLQIKYPHVERVEVCFLGKPTIDYVCKPLGGDTFGFDINFIPGLEGFIQEQIHGNLAPIMYDPNVFPIEIAQMLAGNAVDQAIGVVQVTIHSGQGLKNPDKFPGVPDGYTTVSINNREPIVGKTKTITQNSNPTWHETFNVIVTSLKDSLTLGVFDYNEFRKDKDLGVANFALDQLEQDPVRENVQLEVTAGGRARGVLICDVRFFPVLEAAKLADGTLGEVPESNTGIAKFTVEQAKELDGSKGLMGTTNPYAILLLNGKEIHTSQKLKRTNNPIWPNGSKEFLITDRKTAKLGVAIKDDTDFATDPILGTYQIKLNDLIELSAKGQEWFNLAGNKTGRAKMTLQWKPVALQGGAAGGGYITPIGVMRVHFKNARDLRNMETVGKSDPYARVLLSGIQKGRTVTWHNNLNPDWDEVVYVPMHSAREKLTLEVMDKESSKDRSLGLLELNASDYISQDESGEYLVHDTKTDRSDPLRLHGKGTPKGTLNYTCSFYPCYNVVDPEEEAKEEEKAKASADATPRASIDSTNSSTKGRSERSGTITSIGKGKTSLDMKRQLEEGEKHQDEEEQIKEPPKIKIGVDDLHNYESGLIVFRIVEADLARTGCNIEVVMDDQAFPAYRSPRIRQKVTQFSDTGDAMCKEIEFSRITLRLREKDEEGDAEVLSKLTGSTLDVLKRGLYQETPLTLKDDQGRESRVTVYMRYLPIKMHLDASESINNQGKLRVDILDAANLPAADRNGYSDPYCKFYLNGKQTYKSDTQKKTLHPAWNERFETNIPSRTGADFKVEVWDWDRGDKDDLLGTAPINLEVLDPMEPQEVTLDLDGKSGAIRLKMMFSPSYVARTSQGTSTFSGTFATPGKVIGAPVKGVGKVGTFVGGNVIRGASFMGRGFRSKKNVGGSSDMGSESPEASTRPSTSHGNVINSYPPSSTPQIVTDGASPSTPIHSRNLSDGLDSTPNGPEAGVASLTLVSATGYEGSNVRVFIKQSTPRGIKDLHKTRAVKATPDTDLAHGDHAPIRVNCQSDSQFTIEVKDTHTFGSDVDLGEGTFSLAEVQGSTGGTKIVHVGKGAVSISANFIASEAGSMLTTGNSPGGSKLRKSFLSRSPHAKSPSADDA